MMPVAATSWAASTGRVQLPSSPPLSILSRPRVSKALLLAAAGEVVADKLPFIPARTSPGPLFGRIAFGALVGAAVFAEEGDPVPLGAAVGGVAAGWGAFAGESVRARIHSSGVPDAAGGLLGDLFAAALAFAAVLGRGSRVA
jgi:uncharacterized membrane protein